jgi:hypothetical protein
VPGVPAQGGDEDVGRADVLRLRLGEQEVARPQTGELHALKRDAGIGGDPTIALQGSGTATNGTLHFTAGGPATSGLILAREQGSVAAVRGESA